MRAIFSLVFVVALVMPGTATADEAEGHPAAAAPAAGTSGSAVVLPSKAHALSRVHGTIGAEAAKPAVGSRDVVLRAGKPAAASAVVRPAPTPRTLRKMAPEHAMTAIEPALRACAASNPALTPASFGVRAVVAPSGAVESTGPASGPPVAPALRACAQAAVSAAHFGAPGASGATIVVPVTIPGRPKPRKI